MSVKRIRQLKQELHEANNNNDGTIEWVDYVRGLMMEIDKLEMEMI